MSDYEIADRKDSRALTEFLQKEGQFLLPIVSLIETAQGAIDEVIDVAGRATIEAVLHLSAQEVAGEKHPGHAQGAIRWHGQQSGVVPLSNRKLRVRKPRLRHKEQGEVEVPAYQALRTNSTLAARMQAIAQVTDLMKKYVEYVESVKDQPFTPEIRQQLRSRGDVIRWLQEGLESGYYDG